MPIHFSSYGNLKVTFETAFQHLSFSSFILTYLTTSTYKVCLLDVKFYNFSLKID